MSRAVVSFDVTLSTKERLDAVLAALGAPHEAGPVPGEDAALAIFRSSPVVTDRKPPRSSRMRSLLSTRKAAVIALSGGVVMLSAGAAAAATGSLPGAAQDVASAALAKVGISVPGANPHSAGHADTRGNSTSQPDDSTPPDEGSSGKGSEISQIARTPDLTGVDKGAAVSTAASDGTSQAGQHGGGASAGSDSAPVTTPNAGGTGTADTASGGASTTGTTTAGTHSGGHSATGAANAGSHRP